jgi:hypothetical protein
MPIGRAYSRYLGEWEETKERWRLSINEAERTALFRQMNESVVRAGRDHDEGRPLVSV